MSRYPSEDVARFDQQFAETEDERNKRLRRNRLKRSAARAIRTAEIEYEPDHSFPHAARAANRGDRSVPGRRSMDSPHRVERNLLHRLYRGLHCLRGRRSGDYLMRRYTPFDRVLSALRSFPDGATSKQIAEQLGMHQRAVSSQLSKAFMYGKGLDRTARSLGPGLGRREFVWRAA